MRLRISSHIFTRRLPNASKKTPPAEETNFIASIIEEKSKLGSIT
jgi:hypothetical protein